MATLCVIFVANKTRPTEDMVERGFNANNHGAGIAWREDSKVKWEKGLKLSEIQDLVASVPMPFVTHFRIPSCGGDVPALCHPFPVSPDAELALTGETEGYVLFHNGHWNKWEDMVLEAAMLHELPAGDDWSDSRAMAWLAGISPSGVKMLRYMREKIVVLGPHDSSIFGTGWSERNGVWCSNTSWEFMGRGGSRGYGGLCGDYSEYEYTVCRWGICKVTLNLDSDGYCPAHTKKDFCKLVACKEWADHGKAYCEKHKSLENTNPCAVAGCRERVVMGQGELCKTHRIIAIIGDNKGSGGSSNETPFREGPTALANGTDNQESVEEGEAEASKGAKSGKEANEEEEVVEADVYAVPESLRDVFRWASSINGKKLKRTSTLMLTDGEKSDVDREQRIEALKHGIERIGPL